MEPRLASETRLDLLMAISKAERGRFKQRGNKYFLYKVVRHHKSGSHRCMSSEIKLTFDGALLGLFVGGTLGSLDGELLGRFVG